MPKVIVAGSLNMDIVTYVSTHPKIGETVLGDDLKYFYWWKGANQAVASARLWAQTTMVGMVGNDAHGKDIVKFLEDQGIENKISTHPDAHTGMGIIAVSTQTSDNTIVVISGANFKLSEDEVADIKISKWDVLVSQFEIPLQTIQAFFARGRKIGTINIFNAAPAREISDKLLDLVDILIVNETELEIISGIKINIQDIETISIAVRKIRKNNQTIIVTLWEKWAIGFMAWEVHKIEGRKVSAVDTTWAGDCFVGALSARIANGESIIDAMNFANIAASICVTKSGAWPSMPMLEEVMKAFTWD